MTYLENSNPAAFDFNIAAYEDGSVAMVNLAGYNLLVVKDYEQRLDCLLTLKMTSRAGRAAEKILRETTDWYERY